MSSSCCWWQAQLIRADIVTGIGICWAIWVPRGAEQTGTALAGADGTGQMMMKDTDEDRASRYFDSIAPRYDELISSVTRNIWVRDAFRSLVEETVAPGALLLDFGCGTGTDALWYAERGYRVIAYDNCRAMIDQLRTKCAAAITRGEIIPCHAEYQAFLGLELRPRPVAIVSNFAVLSLISDLP